jgi:hypothetical protein
MLNPFLFSPCSKLVKVARAASDEKIAQEACQLATQGITRHPLTLQLGRLLIRMGNRLVQEDPLQYYKSGHPVN